ncbi:Wzz/FepE/Etk N-terminal domain-containing protein [Gammaproteobacteria bacterium]|nr:Wzz/FepE/Etk N-terminal domain-containing protein [Gammaproteobacteria bacterium]
MENNAQNDNRYDDEIDLTELFGILWAGKLKIIYITALFAVASVIYALSLPDQYKVTTLLAPAQSDSSDLSGALGSLGGIASLAGVNISGGESSEAQIAQEIMISWSFIESFITENNISVELYASKGWNKGSNEIQIDEDLYDTENKQWVKERPTSWQLFKHFSGRLAVSEDKDSGLVEMSIEHYSPYTAKKWLDLYVTAINNHMQQRQMSKVSDNINYLQAQIEMTSIAEMRDVFYNIIEEQTKNKMLAEASPDYVFVEVYPSMIPEIRSSPQRAFICILITFLGAIFSALIVLTMHYRQRSA